MPVLNYRQLKACTVYTNIVGNEPKGQMEDLICNIIEAFGFYRFSITNTYTTALSVVSTEEGEVKFSFNESDHH